MKQLKVSKPVVIKWRGRFAQDRLKGLQDAPVQGNPECMVRRYESRLLQEACKPPEGQTHWSTRDLAKHIGGISHVAVHRILSAERIKPHLYKM